MFPADILNLIYHVVICYIFENNPAEVYKTSNANNSITKRH